jgi:RHS repeat-associated protein
MADSDSAENYQPSMAAPPDGTTPLPLLISATYDYLANSPLVSQIAFSTDQTLKMTTSKQYDFLDRLTNIASILALGGSLASSSAYQYDLLDQRTRHTTADQSFWSFGYDDLGQVTSGSKYSSSGSPVAGKQFGYTYDQIGNRKSAASGVTLPTSTYTVNLLNQILCRNVPGSLPISGEATNLQASILVNDKAPTQQGRYYAADVPFDNSAGPVWASLTNIALVPTANGGELVTKVNGYMFLPSSQECFNYDADGNLISDDRWTYTWDAENRLIKLVTRATVGPQQTIRFDYDWSGRRVQKRVWNSLSTNGPPATDQRFIYDGWNLLAEFNATNNTLIRSYLWGSDLSGSQQGAGGVGGLLAIHDSSTLGGNQSTHFVSYDGNGNVMALVNAATARISAQYEYGPFGELLRATGPMALANPFRFSTKYEDDETGFLCYGLRYYRSDLGRWLNRDPLQEVGGPNVYGFVGNRPQGLIDLDGLTWWKPWTWGDPDPSDNIRVMPNGDWYSPPLPKPTPPVQTAGSLVDWNPDWTGGKRMGDFFNNDVLKPAAAKSVELASMVIPVGSEAKAFEGAVKEAGALAKAKRLANCLSKERGAAEGHSLWEASTASRGFKSFDRLKKYFGSPGDGNVWHHIVEQSKEGKFGAQAIHNVDNVIAIPEKLNAELNRLYSSIRPGITGSDKLTVREWLASKSLQQNYDFGRAALELVSQGIW